GNETLVSLFGGAGYRHFREAPYAETIVSNVVAAVFGRGRLVGHGKVPALHAGEHERNGWLFELDVTGVDKVFDRDVYRPVEARYNAALDKASSAIANNDWRGAADALDVAKDELHTFLGADFYRSEAFRRTDLLHSGIEAVAKKEGGVIDKCEAIEDPEYLWPLKDQEWPSTPSQRKVIATIKHSMETQMLRVWRAKAKTDPDGERAASCVGGD